MKFSTLRLFSAHVLVGLALPLQGWSITITLDATDTANSMDGVDYWNDNRLRAYTSGAQGGGDVDGLIKFDLSSIPIGSTISSMRLTLYAEYGSQNYIEYSPRDLFLSQILIRRVANDAWVRGGSSMPTTYAEVLATDAGPYPSTQHTPYNFALNSDIVDWSADLADQRLTLVLDNIIQDYSYMYWYGSSGVTATGWATEPGPVFDFVPELTVEYQTSVPDSATSTAGLIALSLVACAALRRYSRRSVCSATWQHLSAGEKRAFPTGT